MSSTFQRLDRLGIAALARTLGVSPDQLLAADAYLRAIKRADGSPEQRIRYLAVATEKPGVSDLGEHLLSEVARLDLSRVHELVKIRGLGVKRLRYTVEALAAHAERVSFAPGRPIDLEEGRKPTDSLPDERVALAVERVAVARPGVPMPAIAVRSSTLLRAVLRLGDTTTEASGQPSDGGLVVLGFEAVVPPGTTSARVSLHPEGGEPIEVEVPVHPHDRETPTDIPTSTGTPTDWYEQEDPPTGIDEPTEEPTPEITVLEGVRMEVTPVGFATATCPAVPSFTETTSAASFTMADPILAHSGEYVRSDRDLSVRAGFGPAVSIIRSWRGHVRGTGPFGPGWDFNYDMWLEADGASGNVSLHGGNGRRDTWTATAGGLVPPRGFYGALSRGPSGDWRLEHSDSSRLEFDGTTGQLSAQVDSRGNRVTLVYDRLFGQLVAIRDALWDPARAPDRELRLTWRGDGRLASITDHAGRIVRYAYYEAGASGGPPGTLKSVCVAEDARAGGGPVTAYLYDGAGRLTHVVDPDGFEAARLVPDAPWKSGEVARLAGLATVHNEYDASGRTISQSLGGRPPYRFRYGQGATTLTDPEGNVTELRYDGAIPVSMTRASRGVRAQDPNAPTPDPAAWTIAIGTPRSGGFEPTVLTSAEGAVVTRSYVSHPDPRFGGRLRQVTQSAGGITRTWSFSYDFDIDPAPHSGRIRELAGPEGTTRFAWHADGRVRRIDGVASTIYDHTGSPVDRFEPWVEFDWDAEGNLAEKRESSGLVTRFERVPRSAGGALAHAAGLLAAIIRNPRPTTLDPSTDNIREEFEYDALGRPTAHVDALGRRTEVAYDHLGRPVEVVADGRVLQRHDYLPSGRVDETRAFAAGEWLRRRFAWSRDGLLVELAIQARPGHFLRTRFERDGLGRVVAVVPPAGNATRLTYDERGLLYAVTAAVGTPDQASAYAYYDAGARLVRRVEPGGRIHDVGRDALGRAIAYTDPARTRTELDVDTLGRITEARVRDASTRLLARVQACYDEAGRLVWEDRHLLAPNGASTAVIRTSTRLHPKTGLPVEVVRGATTPGARLRTERLEWDILGRVARTRSSRRAERSFAYDAAGHLIRAEDGTGVARHWRYDPLGRLVAQETRQGTTLLHDASWEYDEVGRLLAMVGTDKSRTETHYDGAGRPTHRHTTLRDPGGARPTDAIDQAFEWDDNFRLVRAEGPDGQVLERRYDARNRLMLERGPGRLSRRIRYGQHGNPISETHADGTVVEYEWDPADRNTAVRVAAGPGTPATDVRFMYDGLGRAVEGRTPEALVQRSFDSLGRLVSETTTFADGVRRSVGLVWEAVSDLAELRYPDGSSMLYGRDGAGRIASLTARRGAQPRPIARFSRDAEGRVTGIDRAGAGSTRMTWDAQGRLTALDHADAGGASLESLAWDHDVRGRRVREVSADGVSTFAFDSAGRMTDWTRQHGARTEAQRWSLSRSGVPRYVDEFGARPRRTRFTQTPEGGIAAIGGVQRAHDGRGNLSDTGALRLQHDAFGRLSRVDSAQGSVALQYDAFGRLLQRRWAPSRGRGRLTRFAYRAEECIAEFDERGRVRRRFCVGDGRDEQLAVERGGEWFHAVHDGRRTARLMVDERGRPVERYAYGPLGEVRITAANGRSRRESLVGNPWLFQGRRYDPDSGLHDFRHRTYEPTTGLFTSPDPIGSLADPHSHANPYLGFGFDPNNRFDPWGLDDEEEGGFWTIVGGIVQLGGGVLEIAGGIGLLLVPEPTCVTKVGGVAMTAHGVDTLAAGFETLWTGRTANTRTAQAGEWLALTAGADESTARLIGTGADLAAGIGPSFVTGLGRKAALSLADDGLRAADDGLVLSLGYKHRQWSPIELVNPSGRWFGWRPQCLPAVRFIGHNVVGVTDEAGTAFHHLAGLPKVTWGTTNSVKVASEFGSDYVITSLRINPNRAALVQDTIRDLAKLNGQPFRFFPGPNCTSSATQLLRAGGVAVPVYAQTPVLLHFAVRYGNTAQRVGSVGAALVPRVALVGPSGAQGSGFGSVPPDTCVPWGQRD